MTSLISSRLSFRHCNPPSTDAKREGYHWSDRTSPSENRFPSSSFPPDGLASNLNRNQCFRCTGICSLLTALPPPNTPESERPPRRHRPTSAGAPSRASGSSRVDRRTLQSTRPGSRQSVRSTGIHRVNPHVLLPLARMLARLAIRVRVRQAVTGGGVGVKVPWKEG